MADRVIKLKSFLPTGDANGLADPDVIRRVLDDPARLRVGIVIFNVKKIETDVDTGDVRGHAAVHRIEAILDDTQGDASALERLLMRAYERRNGETVLDSDLEQDVREAFDGISIIDMEVEEKRRQDPNG